MSDDINEMVEQIQAIQHDISELTGPFLLLAAPQNDEKTARELHQRLQRPRRLNLMLGGSQSENCDRYFDTFDISVPRFNLRISMFVVHAADAEICLSNVKILVSKLSFSPI